jgi:hypothetical protein
LECIPAFVLGRDEGIYSLNNQSLGAFAPAYGPARAIVRSTIVPLLSAVLVIEGFQQLFQLQQNWTRYRSTAEGIRREQYLFR